MKDVRVKEFTLDLRRVLYLSQILQYNLTCLSGGELCPTFIKNAVRGIDNAINRMKADMMVKHPDSWQQVKEDLQGDKPHDISLLLDMLADVENIPGITNAIAILKEEYKASAE